MDLLKETMQSDGVVEFSNWTIPAAMAKTEASEGLTAIHEQCPGVTVQLLLFISVSYLVVHLKGHKWRDMMFVIGGYLMVDVFMAVLHMFLDHPRTRQSPISFIQSMALDFQQHHKNPVGLVQMNHVSHVDPLNAAILGVPLLWVVCLRVCRGVQLPPQIIMFSVSVVLGGFVAVYNHVCCHARTHDIPIPAIIQMAQDWGILPDNKFHREHHLPPHDKNFSFLVGGSKLYDFFYLKLRHLLENYYEVMTFFFVILQPWVVSSFFAMNTLLTKATKEKGS